jgi:hypothetical protein
VYKRQTYTSAWANADSTLATITGSLVNEVFRGNATNQTIDGGAGSDTVDYTYSNVVTANLNTGRLDEGSGGVVDTLLNIENVVSGSGSDLLIGNSANNLLDARAGNDVIYGGAGDDTLMGVGGSDKFYGGSGSDVLYLDSAATVLDGGSDDKVSQAQMISIAQGSGTRTESATVTFADLTANQVLTLAGRTFTASGSGAKAADVATAFASGTVVAGTGALTGTLTDFTVASAGSGVAVFTSSTPTSNVTDLTFNSTLHVDVRTVDSNSGLIAVTRDGTSGGSASAERTTVTFADLAANQVVDLGGYVFTASGTGATAEEVATAYATGTVVAGTGALTGAMSGFTAGTAVGSTVVFTGTTTGNISDLITTKDTSTDVLAVTDRYVDFTARTGLSGIEVIDLQIRGGGVSNTIKLNAASVVAMTNASKTLRVDGQVGDVVLFDTANTWNQSTANVNGLTYDVFTHSATGAKVQVQPGISIDALQGSGSSASYGGSGVSTAGVVNSASSLIDYSQQSGFTYVNFSGIQRNIGGYAVAANNVKRDESGLKTDVLSSIEWLKTGTGADVVVTSETDGKRLDLGSGDDTVWDLAIAAADNTADTILGGDGWDRLYYDRATSAITLDLVAGTSVINGVTDVVRGVEFFYTNAGADVVYGNSDGHWVETNAGNDTVDALGGNDTVYAGANEDLVFGGDGADLLDGGADNDSLMGGEGADAIYGQGGNNRIWGGDGADSLYGQASNADNVSGTDYIEGGAGGDWVYGGLGNDTLIGGADNDTLFGGGSTYQNGYANYVDWTIPTGGSDDDQIDGGTGNDVLYGGYGNDLLIGGTGNDFVGANIYESPNDYRYYGTFYFEAGNDTLIAGDGDDTLMGGIGNDLLYGGDGNDLMGHNNNEFGNDTFVGGLGDDTIYGGDYDSVSYNTTYGFISNRTLGGRDTLDYSASTYSVQVNLDDEGHVLSLIHI